MQKLIFISLFTFMLFACGETKQENKETTESTTAIQSDTQTAIAASLVGLYTHGGHDLSWLVKVNNRKGKWVVEVVEYEGMLPPEEELENYLEEFEFERFDTFEVDEEEKTFNSDWGKGRFVKGEHTMQMIFEEKEGPAESELKLSKFEEK